jgi:hypothetical protein
VYKSFIGFVPVYGGGGASKESGCGVREDCCDDLVPLLACCLKPVELQPLDGCHDDTWSSLVSIPTTSNGCNSCMTIGQTLSESRTLQAPPMALPSTVKCISSLMTKVRALISFLTCPRAFCHFMGKLEIYKTNRKAKFTVRVSMIDRSK